MAKMRFFLCAFLVLCTVSLFGGCATSGPMVPSEPSVPETSTVTTAPTTEAVVFDPWNPATYTGIDDIISITEVEDNRPECTTWTIHFTSNDANVYACVSVPNRCLEEKTPYSCVVYNRGGNPRLGSLTPYEISGYTLTFDSVVVAVELRGTLPATGFFKNGDAEAGDVRKLIDFCEEFAFVDMGRLYMMGTSNGGLRTYMVIREDDRIKKAFVFSGVADLFLTWQYREDMHGLLYNWTGGTPKTKPDEYEKRSATYWADELKCPVLLFHSKLDERVSYEEATKLAAALEKAGKEYKLVSYDDNVHGPHNGDREIIMDWCDFGPKVS